MVDFGGWELPQQYSSIRDEHLAVRKVAGLFDISHMGRLEVTGAGAEAYLQGILTNDLERVKPGHAVYTLMCKPNGGVIDDLVVYRQAEDGFLVVVNAANREKDVAWMQEHRPQSAMLTDRTNELSLIAYQGPRAHELLPDSTSNSDGIPYFGFSAGEVAGVRALISRTGYTGEDGFELFIDSDDVGAVWDAILATGKAAGVLPAGLGARDATRLEAALRLYGNDMDETVNPFEAGLGWTVKLGKGDFIGRDALVKVKNEGPSRTLIGLKTEPGSIPRHGAAVMGGGRRIGSVTSGTHSFFLGYPIALAMIEGPSLRVGEKVAIEVRGREAHAEVTRLPFYRGSARSAIAPARS
jgi:glycine cleavage system T protein (aminomethyltransferase)